MGLGGHVQFLGVRNDIPDLLAASDTVLMPSITEGFPRTAIEAMAAGKPVIATKVGGTPEAVIDGETGLIVPARNLNTMSAAIVQLVDDTELQIKMGLAGRKRAEENYSVEKYVLRLDEIYRGYSGIEFDGTSGTMTLDGQS